MRIVAHMMVKNEPWAWYALQSVLPWVDQVMVVDTGSTDGTDAILENVKDSKIDFCRRTANNPSEVSECRQEMLRRTKGDWLFLVDGDEIWPEFALNATMVKLSATAKFVISSYRNAVGDIYHYQEQAAGRYQIGPFKGHVTIRFFNLSLNLHYQGVYPLEGLYTSDGTAVIDLYTNEPLIPAPYLHLTHLHPSAKAIHNRSHKQELGLSMENDFEYPKAFYLPHPSHVPDIWQKRSSKYLVNALWQTPLKFIKRRIFK